jgi:hypothetical protein
MMSSTLTEIDSGYTSPTWYSEADEKEQKLFRDWLRGLLRTNTVHLTFRKKDDTIREMTCTLMESKLPQKEQGKESRKENDTSIPVFDLEKNEWRAFRFDSIKQINFTLGE